MKTKYYAIKKGKQRGVFTESWEVVKDWVQGYTGSVYKSFTSLEDAELWFYDSYNESIKEDISDELTVTAYVDGSGSMTIDEYGSGVVILYPNGNIEEFSFKGNNPDARELKNIAGELSASMRAMKLAREKGYKKLILCYDYQGIEQWAVGNWKCKNNITRLYKEWFDKNIKEYIQVEFKWVKGHSGNKYNDLADLNAKKAIGI